jgi:hypothetical protein
MSHQSLCAELARKVYQKGRRIRFLRTSDVAWLLDTPSNTIDCWTEAGILKCHHLDRQGERIFKREDIADLLARLGA